MRNNGTGKEGITVWENKEDVGEWEDGEKIVWRGKPTQHMNLDVFILCTLLFWLIVPAFIAFFKWLETKNTEYILTNQRLQILHGILTKRVDDLELFRIKDIAFIQPLLASKFNCGDIVLYSADSSHPVLKLESIHEAHKLRELLRKMVLKEREKRGIREVDYYTAKSARPF